MEESGITFELAAPILCKVVANGTCQDDPRVIEETNAATLELMSSRDPTGQAVLAAGMATVDIVADGTTILLPKELKNVYEVEVLGVSGVNGKHVVRQGWYDIVNPFIYIDPNLAHDNPLVDLGYVPYPGNPTANPPVEADPTIRIRKYDYPGLDEGATVRVTGAKAYLPITGDSFVMLIQNIPALELMLLARWNRVNGNRDLGKAYKDDAVALIVDDIKSALLDPKQTLKRKAKYDQDLATLPMDSFGYTVARLAHELPGGLQMGYSELVRLAEQAEQRCMTKGHPVGTLEEFSAEVTHGRILAPAKVKTILAADLCGQQLDIRNIFFQYVKSGPGRTCFSGLIDEGEFFESKTKKRYRQYRLGGECMRQYYSRSQTSGSSSSGTGGQGEKGDPGTPGTPGTQWRFGTTDPDDSVGLDGDNYVKQPDFILYHKQNGHYEMIGTLKGVPGSPGSDSLPMVLNVEGLEGVDDRFLSGYDLDGAGITPDRTFIVTIGDQTSFYTLQEGEPDVSQFDVSINDHPEWHYRRTGS